MLLIVDDEMGHQIRYKVADEALMSLDQYRRLFKAAAPVGQDPDTVQPKYTTVPELLAANLREIVCRPAYLNTPPLSLKARRAGLDAQEQTYRDDFEAALLNSITLIP